MNLQDLRYLVALANHGHFGRAAEACHITQPTLSAQLKKLEAFLGLALFERTNKQLRLTPAGVPILAKAREVVASVDALVSLAREQAKPMSGPFHLGVIPTLGPYLLPWLLPVLKTAFPLLRPVLLEDVTANLVSHLKDHSLDAALLALPLEDDALRECALFDEPFYFACPKDHRLAKMKMVETAELENEPLLLLSDGHCLRDQILAVCGQSMLRNDTVDFRATSLETLRQMVAAGMGCTLLPALARGEMNSKIAIRPLSSDAFRRIGLVWRKTHPKPADMESLCGEINLHLPPEVKAVG